MSASIEYCWGISAQTVQAKMWLDADSDVAPAATITLTEKDNEPGCYKATTSLQGLYKAQILVNGAEWDILWINIPATGYAVFEQSRLTAKQPPSNYVPPPINPIQPA